MFVRQRTFGIKETTLNKQFDLPDQPCHDRTQQARGSWIRAEQRRVQHGGQLHCAALHKSLRLMLLLRVTQMGGMLHQETLS